MWDIASGRHTPGHAARRFYARALSTSSNVSNITNATAPTRSGTDVTIYGNPEDVWGCTIYIIKRVGVNRTLPKIAIDLHGEKSGTHKTHSYVEQSHKAKAEQWQLEALDIDGDSAGE